MKIDANKLVYRKMDKNDLDIFVKLRFAFLYEFNHEATEKNKETIKKSLESYFEAAISKNEFIGIVCEYEGNVISSAYMAISEKPANFHFINGKIGTLLNVYTHPEYRKNGITSHILKMIIDEAKKENLSEIELLATEAGEPLYRKLGFTESEMKYMKLEI